MLEQYFPNLVAANYKITSPTSPVYNCIAWAVGDSSRWWWPDRMNLAYWPENVPREENLDSFCELLQTRGFESCEEPELEANCDKIALYAKGQHPTHAARQLASGKWTSKLGPLEDIEHELEDLVGDCYGTVAVIFRKKRR